jgi:peptidylprolyl isomerase
MILQPAGYLGRIARSARRVGTVVLTLSVAMTLSACKHGGGDSATVAGPSGSTASSAAPSSQLSGTGGASATPAASAGASAAAAAPNNPFPTASPFPEGDKAQPGMPAITANATTFDKEPTIAKGEGAAPSNLFVRDLIVGTGKAAVATDTVNVRYVGALYSDGTVFDASWKSGSAPIAFPLSGVVPGFAGGIVGMKIGGRREISIPGFLAYGANPPPGAPIPPDAALVFVVDLVSIQ